MSQLRHAAAAALAVAASAAQASEASTGMGESGGSAAQLGMIIGGVAVMGVVIYFLIKFVSR